MVSAGVSDPTAGAMSAADAPQAATTTPPPQELVDAVGRAREQTLLSAIDAKYNDLKAGMTSDFNKHVASMEARFDQLRRTVDEAAKKVDDAYGHGLTEQSATQRQDGAARPGGGEATRRDG